MVAALSKWDDYFIHQTEFPIQSVSGDERYRLDSCYVGVMGVDEHIFLSLGLRSYPNTRNMAAYALAWSQGVQYNFRATREINNDREDTVVGPFSIDIVEPHKRWRLKLDNNEYAPISYDLELRGLTAPYLCQTTAESNRFGDRYCHLAQPCRFDGQLTVAGKTYEVRQWTGPRDRYWGLTPMFFDIGLSIWVVAQFKGFNVFISHVEQRDGSIRFSEGAIMREGGNVPITKIEHDLTLEPRSRRIRSAKLWLTAADNTQVVLQGTPSDVGVFMAGAWCGEDWAQNMGHLHLEGDSWNLRDADTFDRLARLLGHWICKLRCGDEEGVGFFEYGVSRKHVRYGAML